MSNRTTRAIALAGAFLALPTIAIAQEPPRGVGVADRPREEFDPVGVRAGAFLIYPRVTSSVEYTDNLFKTDNNEQDDVIYQIGSSVAVLSDWNRHFVRLGANITTNAHDENDSDDITDYGANLAGRLDITRDTFVDGRVAYALTHEDRGSPDLPGAVAAPPEVETFDAATGITHRFNRMNVGLRGTFKDQDFDDAGLIGGGTINNDDRDRQTYEAIARVGYDFSPGYQGFIEGSYQDVNYDNLDDQVLAGGGRFNRDSERYAALAGLAFDVGSVARGEIGVGYIDRNYDASNLEDISGLGYRADGEWYVTELTTVRFGGSRKTEETTITNASGIEATNVRLGVDHELLYNVILSADAGYTNNAFEGVTREDDKFNAGLKGTYLINRHFRASLGYAYDERDSNVVGSDYQVNSVKLTLRAQL